MPSLAGVLSTLPYPELTVSLLAVLLAVALGTVTSALVRRFLIPRLEASEPGGFVPRLVKLARAGMTAIFIVAFSAVRGDDVGAAMVLATALGFALAIAAYQIARALDAKSSVAAGLGFVVFVLILVGGLGGLRPLLASLASTRLGIGATAVSLLDIVNTVFIAILLFILARASIGFLSRWIGSAGAFDPSQRVLFQKFAQITVITVAIFIGIDVLGIDLTALAVFSGAFGLAIGFGMQKTFGNLLSGLILLMDRSIKPGDVIAVGDTFGWVNKIGVRAVSVLTRDGKEHLIPNERLMTEEVENWSYSSRDVRVHVAFSVSYDCDLRLVQRLAVEAATVSSRVLHDPTAVCWIKAFGESAVEFDLRFWIDDPEAGVGNVISDVFLRIWDSFKEHDIKLPFPQHDVHLRSIPADLLAEIRRP
jgi:small-conductance mechanosensitive channel